MTAQSSKNGYNSSSNESSQIKDIVLRTKEEVVNEIKPVVVSTNNLCKTYDNALTIILEKNKEIIKTNKTIRNVAGISILVNIILLSFFVRSNVWNIKTNIANSKEIIIGTTNDNNEYSLKNISNNINSLKSNIEDKFEGSVQGSIENNIDLSNFFDSQLETSSQQSETILIAIKLINEELEKIANRPGIRVCVINTEQEPSNREKIEIQERNKCRFPGKDGVIESTLITESNT